MIETRRTLEGKRWVHAYNRGVSRRPIFERQEDFRFFRRALSLAVRRTKVEVHAYCQLTTHFHLLLRVEAESVSDLMHGTQSVYARWFNEHTGRRGPLMEGRFGAVAIRSHLHWQTVVRYIDANPVEAGLARRASEYQHCSRIAYAGGHAPRWLTRSSLERFARERAGIEEFSAAAYETAFPPLRGDGFASIQSVMARTRELRSGPYLSTLPPSVRRDFAEATRNADGEFEVLDELALPPELVLGAVREVRASEPVLLEQSPTRRDVWRDMAVGLLHEAAACRGCEVAALLGISRASVSRSVRAHANNLTCEFYRRARSEILRRVRRDVFS